MNAASTTIELDPVVLDTNVVRGTVLPRGKGMVLVTQPQAINPAASGPPSITLFLLRPDDKDGTHPDWYSALLGTQIREESITFSGKDIDIHSKATFDSEGFKATGGVISTTNTGFDAEIVRNIEQQTRIHREMRGTKAGGLHCVTNTLNVFNRKPGSIELLQIQRHALNIGLQMPRGASASVDGTYTAIPLMGSGTHQTWKLANGMFTSTRGDEAPIEGTYTSNQAGEITLIATEGQHQYEGVINTDLQAGLVFSEQDNRLSQASLWRNNNATPSTPLDGEWVACGVGTSENDAPMFLSGSVDITSSGEVSGELIETGTGSSWPLSGKINFGKEPSGSLQFAIPVQISSNNVISTSATSSTPHSH